MSSQVRTIPVLFLLISALLSACGTDAADARGTAMALALQLTLLAQPTDTEGPAVMETSQPSSGEPTPAIAHVAFPAEPSPSNNFMTDQSSQALASERRANADSFSLNIYERPFTAGEMDYQAYLDITRGELYADENWFYVTISLVGSPPEGSEATYTVEIDLDVDGRGDWYIGGLAAPSAEWTTDGAFAYHDANGDVGGPKVLRSDGPLGGGDGFEELVFDQGLGADADAVWVRRHPTNSNRVQVAFKRSLIGNDTYFMWGVWSDEGMRDPGLLDYHDYFTHDEAGSPVINLAQYPLKSLYSLDNTCRWAYGFAPTGNEPGVCYIQPTPTNTPVPRDKEVECDEDEYFSEVTQECVLFI